MSNFTTQLREEVLMAMETATIGEEAFTDGSVDTIVEAITKLFSDLIGENDQQTDERRIYKNEDEKWRAFVVGRNTLRQSLRQKIKGE